MHAAPACDTATACPATVSVAFRAALEGFAATEKPTAPLPVPLAPLVTVTQPAPLDAVQPQPPTAVTATLDAAAALDVEKAVDEMPYEHGIPGCVTVKVCPPAVIFPVRDVELGFAVAENDTVPLADPLPPSVMVSHAGAALDAVHEHADPVTVRTREELPPAEGAVQDEGDMLYEHVEAA